MMFQPSPLTAAKRIAVLHADLTGELRVASLTPGGRGGWKVKTKVSKFWIVRGEAYPRRSGWHKRNGPCDICGKFSKLPDRFECLAPDPAPGTKIGAWPGESERPILSAEFASVECCVDCQAKHGFGRRAPEYPFWTPTWTGEALTHYVQTRRHPQVKPLPSYAVDIRPVVEGKAALENVEVIQEGTILLKEEGVSGCD